VIKKITTLFLVLLIVSQCLLAMALPEDLNRWAVAAIHADDAKITADTDTVRIALIDTGIQNNSHYLDYSKIEIGYNYAVKGENTNDLVGHGTRIAGLILGGSSNKSIINGIASNVILIPLVYYSKYPSGVPINGGLSAICKAIYDAVDVYLCKIINISSGIGADYAELRKAVEYAEEKGVIVISAVGNSHMTMPDKLMYPAAYDSVIGVGAVDQNLEIASFSQRNSSVMVTAPGKDVYSLSIKGGTDFEKISGTSYATTYVVSFAALLLSAYPDMTPSEFRQVLRISSKDLGEPGYDEEYGWGLIDIAAGFEAYEQLLTIKCFCTPENSVDPLIFKKRRDYDNIPK
jgi:subtilisin family serine protease